MVVADAPQPTLSEHSIELVRTRRDAAATTAAWQPSQSLRLTVPLNVASSRWFHTAVTRLEAAMNLQAGWDSYGGVPAHLGQVERAIFFLATSVSANAAPPAVVPLSAGGVQLIWHTNGIDIEATFADDGDTDLYIRDLEDGMEYDLDPFEEHARSLLRGFSNRLSA